MSEEHKVSEGKLLYDPLFAKKPDTDIHDDPTKGLLGKAKFKKAIFIVCLVVFVGVSLFFSFNSISRDTYKFEENDNGWLFSEFSGASNYKVLNIDYVVDENGVPDKTKRINEIREFAVCCDEYLEYIYVSDTVDTISPTAFYYCKTLKAVIVHPDNKNYVSIDGVLYKAVNGVASEIMLYPMQNGYYRAALALGYTAPEDASQIDKYMSLIEQSSAKIAEKYKTVGVNYEIKDTVTKIGQLCFSNCEELESVKIPSGVTEIETLAFLKCKALKSIYLPDGLKIIGSDAFNTCAGISYIFIPDSVTEIGHHAFSNCSSATCVYMGHADDSGLTLGTDWLPKVKKVLMHDVEVLYAQTREGNENV